MKLINTLAGRDYEDYRAWLRGDPVIPAGMNSVEAFIKLREGQRKIGDY